MSLLLSVAAISETLGTSALDLRAQDGPPDSDMFSMRRAQYASTEPKGETQSPKIQWSRVAMEGLESVDAIITKMVVF